MNVEYAVSRDAALVVPPSTLPWEVNPKLLDEDGLATVNLFQCDATAVRAVVTDAEGSHPAAIVVLKNSVVRDLTDGSDDAIIELAEPMLQFALDRLLERES